MRKALPYLVVLLLFLVCYGFTSPDYIGDTTSYAVDVINHAQGQHGNFWEFGHLLWRPWGYVGYSLLGPSYVQRFGDAPMQVVARFLIQTNFICSLAAVLLTMSLLQKVVRVWTAAAVAVAMNCAASFLNYSHSGAPYLPALLFSVAAFLLLIRSLERRAHASWYACLAGFSYALACALWFPYAFAGLGMLAVPLLWPSPATGPALQISLRRRRAGVFLLSLSVSVLFLFALGAASEGVTTTGRLAQWIRNSDHGWSQSMNAMRAITGVPRAVWDFGNTNIFLKRWLFSDPFNPAGIRSWVFSLSGKLAVFYSAMAAMLWVLWKERRDFFWILLAGGLPLLLFAVFLFEPSSPERFLPAFPFVYLAFGIVLDRPGRHPMASLCVALLLFGTVLLNLAGERDVTAAHVAETRRRTQALNHGVQPLALVFVMTMNDDLYRLPSLLIMDKTLAPSRFRVVDLIVVANRSAPYWRSTFADRTREQWDANEEVWISERLLAKSPESNWLWVEGDDRRVGWRDLPAVFGPMEYDAKISPGNDGFVRLAPTPANRNRLNEIGETRLPTQDR